jgi:hypothetical protein
MAQLTVSTVVPEGCSTVMTALVKAMSVMFSFQLVLGLGRSRFLWTLDRKELNGVREHDDDGTPGRGAA